MSDEVWDAYSAENLGSMEIALAISLIFFGILVIQAYNYYQNFDDRLPLKSLVTVVSILEVFHTFTITHTIYFSTVTRAGSSDIGPNSYPLTTGVVLETLITYLIQSYFAYRIYRISGKLYIPIICWAISLLRLGGGLATAAESYLNVPLLNNAIVVTQSFGWLITLSISVGAAADLLIALSLCYYIKRLVPPNPSQSVGALVDRLVTWTIQTGLVTSMTSVAVVILFHTIEGKETWFAVYTVLAKLYSNSFFVALNNRQINRQTQERSTGIISKLVFTDNPPSKFTVDISRCSRSTDSFASDLHTPDLSFPEKAYDSDATFRGAVDVDIEARRHACS